jgi:hypothetical protein
MKTNYTCRIKTHRIHCSFGNTKFMPFPNLQFISSDFHQPNFRYSAFPKNASTFRRSRFNSAVVFRLPRLQKTQSNLIDENFVPAVHTLLIIIVFHSIERCLFTASHSTALQQSRKTSNLMRSMPNQRTCRLRSFLRQLDNTGGCTNTKLSPDRPFPESGEFQWGAVWPSQMDLKASRVPPTCIVSRNQSKWDTVRDAFTIGVPMYAAVPAGRAGHLFWVGWHCVWRRWRIG